MAHPYFTPFMRDAIEIHNKNPAPRGFLSRGGTISSPGSLRQQTLNLLFDHRLWHVADDLVRDLATLEKNE